MEVLCSCAELEVRQRDRWNRTPLDMASGDLKDILLNRGNLPHVKRPLSHIPSTTHPCKRPLRDGEVTYPLKTPPFPYTQYYTPM